MEQPLKQTPICKQMPGCANRRLAKSAQHLWQRTTRNRGCFPKRFRLVDVRASQHAGNTADVCKGRRGLGRDGQPSPMLQNDQIPPRTEEDTCTPENIYFLLEFIVFLDVRYYAYIYFYFHVVSKNNSRIPRRWYSLTFVNNFCSIFFVSQGFLFFCSVTAPYFCVVSAKMFYEYILFFW